MKTRDAKLITEDQDWCETRLRVRYAETDQAGVVYHANYLIWFEVGRVELCRAHGFNYRDLEREADTWLPVIEAYVKYHSPARYDEEILVRTRVAQLRRRFITFTYQVVRAADRALLAEGETRHIVLSLSGKPRSFPPEYVEKLRAARGAGTL